MSSVPNRSRSSTPAPLSDTVTRLRAATDTDRRNDTVYDWSDTDEADIEGCAVAPRTSAEDNTGRTAVIVGLTLYAPFDADILAVDRIVYDGMTYEVDGAVGRWRNPFSQFEAGLEVALKRVDG